MPGSGVVPCRRVGLALVAVLFLFSGAAWGALTTSHFSDVNAALAVAEATGGAVRFTAEARIGGEEDWEMAIRRHPSVLDDETLAANHFDTWLDGVSFPFTLTYDAERKVLTMALIRRFVLIAKVDNRPAHDLVGDFNELFIRTEAVDEGSSIVVDNLSLDGEPLEETSAAISEETEVWDVLRIQGANLAEGFTLTGRITLRWTGEMPAGSHLGVQIWGAKVVEGAPDTEPPSIVLLTPPEGAFVNTSSVLVTGVVSDAGEVVSVSVNGAEATLAGGEFEAIASLEDGYNEILVAAADAEGNTGIATRALTLDRTPPSLNVTAPAPDQLTNQEQVRVAGEATDDMGLAVVEVQGSPVSVAENEFTATVPVSSGSGLIAVRAVDLAGNETSANLQVIRFDLPEVTIDSPEDLSFIASTTADVRGTVSDPEAQVTVNTIPATVSGTSFLATDVPLIEGGNILTATAADTSGHIGTFSINVVRDLTPPRLAVLFPREGAVVFEPAVTVVGMVNDIVAGTVNASEATVTVNGRRATVANRSFIATDVPLEPGENVLAVTATDESGNIGEARLTVRLEPPTGARVSIVSGNLQEAVIGTALSQPLVVSLRDSAGLPAAGKPVLFRVRGNNGSLDGGKRQIAVVTDAAGLASTNFTLGTRAGAGGQVIEASAPGYHGPAVFTATALPGPPAFLLVDAGDQQVGVAGRLLPRPLVAVVTDQGYNRLEGAMVRFNVVLGQGRLAKGLQETLVFSDSDGRVIVPFTLDPEEGIANNIVEARIEGLDSSPLASFVASGRAAGDPAATSISGVVLDNSNQPLKGVTLRVLETSLTAQTDELGLFKINGAPVGTVKLVVDGSTAERPGSWPDLEFVLTTIPGRDNTVNMPIYLLPLDLRSGVTVDETHGGTLTLPEIPGLALEIAPGSVTFPGGSKSGVVSVTVVHNDKVPMVPNFGQQPRLIVTIQPAGARFDPPARLTLPNVEGLAPGEVTEMYSFDHDLGHFVSIGPATVSEDGSVIVSNPGVGILKAGWHCGGNPATAGTPHRCPECKVCSGSQCVEGCSLKSGDRVDKASTCNCGKVPGMVCHKGKCVCAVPVNFRKTAGGTDTGGGNLRFTYKWDSNTGKLSDLSACQVGEQVVYPSGVVQYTWPAPWSGSTPSPTVLLFSATIGTFNDDHSTLPIVPPYGAASFTAQQRYIYTCPCDQNGAPVQLLGILPIVRSITKKPNGSYMYEITKTGSSAKIDPLP